MTFKKMIALGTCLCLSLAAFCGCAKDGETEPSDVQTEPTTVVETTAMNISETLVYNEDDIKVWFSQPKIAPGETAQFFVSIENQTESIVTLSVDAMVINNVTLPAFLYCDIPAGEKNNETISFSREELSEYGIEEFASAGFTDAVLTDGETFTENLQFNIASDSLETSEFEQPEKNDGIEIVNKDGIQIIAQKFYKDYFGDYYLRLFVKNTSGKDVNVTARNTKINNKSADGWMYEYMANNTWTLCDIGFYGTDIENMNLDVIENISAHFDAKTSDYEIVMESDTVTIALGQLANPGDEELQEATADNAA